MSARLQDVELKLSRRRYHLASASAVVLAILLLVGAFLFSLLRFPADMLCTFGLIVLVWPWLRRIWTSQWERDFRSASPASDDLATCIRAAVESAPAGRPELAAGLARFLASAGSELLRPGEAVRIASPCRPIEPLDVAIEPLTLDRRDPAFRALRDVKSSRVPIWAVLLLLPVIAWLLMRVYASPAYTVTILVAAGAGMAIAVFQQWHHNLLTPTWFAVPAALIRRWPLRKGVRLCPAGTCRLIVVSEPSEQNSIVVLPPDERPQHFRLGDVETDALLAAWLSPLPPPTDEQLTELGA